MHWNHTFELTISAKHFEVKTLVVVVQYSITKYVESGFQLSSNIDNHIKMI